MKSFFILIFYFYSMSIAASKSPFYVVLKSLGLLFLFLFAGLYLDSTSFADVTPNAQFYANGVMFVVTLIVFTQVTKRCKEQMITAILIAIVGEYLFSIVMGMYAYRLGNIPHYVPPGHALVYITVLYFSKASAILKQRISVEKFFTIFILIYAAVFLIVKNDVFGFAMTIATLLILRNKPRERLFYLTMYITVAYLEIIGTNYGCWKWPSTAWGVFDFLPSHNPPSGISFFYFLLDLTSLWLYKQRHKLAWSRMKTIRTIRTKKLVSIN